ncbi:MAG: DJ-1/PfpI family protein [Candidatus Buchananbacteria bacterium]|nr:DJ-1/PfpI family protein [Candidatus Buchananbacteria bacterium]
MKKRVVFIVAQNAFRDEELLEPKKILDNRGFEAKVAAKTRNRAVGKLGTEITPDMAVAEVKPQDFDAAVFIGGPGAVSYFNDGEVLQLVRDFRAKRKLIGAICIAPSILANAGILISKTVTAFPSEEENLKDRGADYTGMPVEVDDLIVTAKDPAAAKEFGERLAYLLEG